ncbi:MAG: tRNA uridine-5-carboxymethylaminomethyl(34) synthesis enzyme MnmG [Cyanobacteria bacterium HKST-UBA04]|nr:tRNA uridine-5-carboxymethylaminomethyl(34) synthesis enzyme MnmG [Cyanobacteria bacterium HKST-UBA04]
MTAMLEQRSDVIVIGGGHAGIEAAMAAAKLGCRTLLMCMNLDTIGQMSCNPAIGGPAKSQLVKEIDALGGVMGLCADATYLQLKTLNLSKGPAVHALRAQSDKTAYRDFARTLVETEPNLKLRQTMAVKLHTADGQIVSVEDNLGIEYPCGAVILANGTFLNGRLFIGEKTVAGGRAGEAAATGITADLVAAGMTTGRLKTGTPPRLDGRSIDFSGLDIHPGDPVPSFFSFLPDRPVLEQVPCHMTRTTAKTHEIIRNNLHRSPMFSGLIEGEGPRYCPSIEDKVVRFADRPSHHLFIEPEGRNSYEMYLQGFSSSLPIDVQMAMLATLPGLEKVEMIRPACAVEYDYFPAYQLHPSLMTKALAGVFCAGQINGTSGYEEAAAQGLMAGINAARFLARQAPFVLPRESSYIGTMIDDLVTKEILEPYRMLTSRSEYRLLLRQDNADARLTPLGHQIGLVDEFRWQVFQAKQAAVQTEFARLKTTKLDPNEANAVLAQADSSPLSEKTSLFELLRRPEIGYDTLARLDATSAALNLDNRPLTLFCETEIKYEGYIKRQQQAVGKLADAHKIAIPAGFDYKGLKQLSNESREKLDKLRPTTLAQAMRINGVTPADASILQVVLSR